MHVRELYIFSLFPYSEHMQGISQIFSINSVWFFVAQAVVWFALCLVMIASTDTARPQQNYTRVKQNLGFFFLFVTLTGGLLYMVFGHTPMG